MITLVISGVAYLMSRIMYDRDVDRVSMGGIQTCGTVHGYHFLRTDMLQQWCRASYNIYKYRAFLWKIKGNGIWIWSRIFVIEEFEKFLYRCETRKIHGYGYLILEFSLKSCYRQIWGEQNYKDGHFWKNSGHCSYQGRFLNFYGECVVMFYLQQRH